MTGQLTTDSGVLRLRRGRRAPVEPAGGPVPSHTYASDAYRPQHGAATTALGRTEAAHLLDRSTSRTTQVVDVFGRIRQVEASFPDAPTPIFDHLAARFGLTAPAGDHAIHEGGDQ